MLLKVSDINFNVKVNESYDKDKSLILFLHGFTGYADDWEPIFPHIKNGFNLAALDLTGHGESDSPEDVKHYTADAISFQINEIINQLTNDKVILIGYSMGGRAALIYSLNYQEKVKALILESATAGISDEQQRQERLEKDELLAEYIRTHTIEEFVDYWMELDIFGTQKRLSNEQLKIIKEKRVNNSKTGLANSLLGFGTGTMVNIYERLKNFKIKTLLLSGDLDTKFTKINSTMVKIMPDAVHKRIKTAGHNIHLEEQKAFVSEVNNFISSL